MSLLSLNSEDICVNLSFLYSIMPPISIKAIPSGIFFNIYLLILSYYSIYNFVTINLFFHESFTRIVVNIKIIQITIVKIGAPYGLVDGQTITPISIPVIPEIVGITFKYQNGANKSITKIKAIRCVLEANNQTQLGISSTYIALSTSSNIDTPRLIERRVTPEIRNAQPIFGKLCSFLFLLYVITEMI